MVVDAAPAAVARGLVVGWGLGHLRLPGASERGSSGSSSAMAPEKVRKWHSPSRSPSSAGVASGKTEIKTKAKKRQDDQDKEDQQSKQDKLDKQDKQEKQGEQDKQNRQNKQEKQDKHGSKTNKSEAMMLCGVIC